LSQGQKLPFFYQQVITSRNLADHWLLNFLTGGLNHQIEHHLFPAAPRTHYVVTRPLVQALCAKTGVPYQEVGYMQATVEVWSHFRAMAMVAGGQVVVQEEEEGLVEAAAQG
jgi:fatty acid desaturase